MTVVNQPNGDIRLICDLCPIKFQDVKAESEISAAAKTMNEGWKVVRHDKDHYSNICPECVASIKED